MIFVSRMKEIIASKQLIIDPSFQNRLITNGISSCIDVGAEVPWAFFSSHSIEYLPKFRSFYEDSCTILISFIVEIKTSQQK